MLFLAHPSLGCFEGVDLLLVGNLGGNVGGHVAAAVFPLQGRLGTSAAIPAGRHLCRAVATIARLDDFMARTAIIVAPFRGHKGALGTFSDGFANQGNHLQFMTLKKARKNFSRPSPGIKSRGW
jgi:hypothetical protein